MNQILKIIMSNVDSLVSEISVSSSHKLKLISVSIIYGEIRGRTKKWFWTQVRIKNSVTSVMGILSYPTTGWSEVEVSYITALLELVGILCLIKVNMKPVDVCSHICFDSPCCVPLLSKGKHTNVWTSVFVRIFTDIMCALLCCATLIH